MNPAELTSEQKEHLREWVVALRSRKYKQGKRVLRNVSGDQDEYCCLGVACEVSKVGKWVVNINEPNVRRYIVVLDDNTLDGSTLVLPVAVADFFGIDTDPGIGKTLFSNEPMRATYANDTGTSFAQIADGIEKYYEL